MKRNAKPAETTELPPNVKETDLKFPKHGESVPWETRKELGIEFDNLQFYRTNGFGWVLCTLGISGPGKRAGSTARTYGITVEGNIVRVGKGPHVTKEITVWLSKDNLERLTKYVELWKKGSGDAGSIRDRISTRRAQGQLNRAGLRYWDW